jgi:hypothetical protein
MGSGVAFLLLRCRAGTIAAALAAAVAAFSAVAQDNARAVRDFGTYEGPPITRGFFFWKWKYVRPPYTVERRGLDVYINGFLAQPGPVYPPQREAIPETDPGDPPPDAPIFFDKMPADWPHRSKYLYLLAKHGKVKARDLMVRVFASSPQVSKVYVDPETGDCIAIEGKGGQKTFFTCDDPGEYRPPPTKEFFEQTRDRSVVFYEGHLRMNSMLVLGEGLESFVPPPLSVQIMKVLVGTGDPEEKSRRIQNEVLKRAEHAGVVPDFLPLARAFAPCDELTRRVLEAAEEPERSVSPSPPLDPSRG